MAFADWYAPLRQAHIGLVVLSVTLFALRGLGVLAGARWPLAAWARRGSAGIDTLLLAAGATLWAGLGLNPWIQTWLGVKLLLLPVYIVLGSLALRRARTPALRAICFVGALAVVSAMAGIARSHDPGAGIVGVSGKSP